MGQPNEGVSNHDTDRLSYHSGETPLDLLASHGNHRRIINKNILKYSVPPIGQPNVVQFYNDINQPRKPGGGGGSLLWEINLML